MNDKILGRCGVVFLLMLLLAGCSVIKVQNGNQIEMTPLIPALVDVNTESADAKILLDYFNKQYPDSPVSDSILLDVDNDGYKELLLALNTYSGADKMNEEEVREQGFNLLYVGVIFPKGENTTESVIVVGKTFEEGMHFVGSNLFEVKKIGNLTDQVKIRITSKEGKSDYFTMKLTIGADGIRKFQ